MERDCAKPDPPGDRLEGWLDLRFGELALGRSVTLPVLSGSMSPLLMPGAEVRIERVSWRECRVGEVILFRNGRELFAHRLLGRIWTPGGWRLFQKGDSNPVGHWVRPEQVVGRVTAVRGLGSDGFVPLPSGLGARLGSLRELGSDLWYRFRALARRAMRCR